MSSISISGRFVLLLTLVCSALPGRAAGEFDDFLKPLFADNCVKCHGGEKVKGKVNLKELATAEQFLAKPGLIEELIEVIDAHDMPPEDEPGLDEQQRVRLLASLKTMLRDSTAGSAVAGARIRRLNRFQYNNAVRDLFKLNRDVFSLSEKLMTRHGNYLQTGSGKMPDKVEVACLSLAKGGGMREVNAFPKDLRAAHGFDNQANQLTLSPLLLDAFLKLSVSVVESPDFNAETVGIWNGFFKEPEAGSDMQAEIRKRLMPFLWLAFRGPVDRDTVERYASYTIAKTEEGLSFTDAMKKAASAAMSSPMFLYRYTSKNEQESEFELAAKLSFFLWGSGPDWELLRVAKSGELSKPEVLNATVDRMFADPKIERFLDTFPSQWMQLENVLAATPDPAMQRLFSLDKSYPASLQMVLEPLLLFDAVFIENRPIDELIAPSFGYRSAFLKDWYGSDLMPAAVNEQSVAAENKARVERRKAAEAKVQERRRELDGMGDVRAELIRKKLETVDINPGMSKWEAAQTKLVAESVVISPWHRIGPFGAGNFDEAHAKAFINETAVDMSKAHGKLKWEKAENLADGQVHQLSGDNSAYYLYRTLHSESARSLELSLGSDDSFKLWLNGKLVTDNKVTRGVAPDQDKVQVNLTPGENSLLFKIANGSGGFGFYFRAQTITLPGPVIAALKVKPTGRNAEQQAVLRDYYYGIAPELTSVRDEAAARRAELDRRIGQLQGELQKLPQPKGIDEHRREAQRRFDEQMRNKLRSQAFERVAATDPRYGGVVTNAAMLSMTSGPKRTHPIARGAWLIEVIFNDPPPPPPNDVPPLNEDAGDKNLTIREKFAVHRENPDCAGCHSRLDPLGFALENFDITGRWRDKYDNGRDVDSSGTLMQKYDFDGVVAFKQYLVKENRRFAKAFSAHLLRYALSRELGPADALTIDAIVEKTQAQDFLLKSVIREVIFSDPFLRPTG